MKAEILLVTKVFPIIFGTFLIVFHSQAAKSAVKWNDRILGIRFNETGYKVAAIIGGLFFIIFGVLTCIGTIKFRQ